MPIAEHPFHARDYLTLNAYWFALSFMWNAMAPILLPTIVAGVVAESQKASALGALSAIGLIVATVVQPVTGAWTDTHATRWGRRRPFIVGGTLFDLIFLVAIAFAGNYFVLLVAYVLLQISSNIAHGPYQAYLPELAPVDRRGKVTGVKQFLEMAGAIVTALVVGNLVGQGLVVEAFAAIIFFLLLTAVITVLFVDERPFDGAATKVESPANETAAASPVRALFHSRDFFLWLVSRLLILVAVNLVRNYVLYFLGDVLQIQNPAQETGNLLAVLGIAVAVIAYPAGALSDRWGRKPLIVFSGVLGTMGALILIFATTMTMVIVAGTIIGISVGVFLSVNWAWGTDLIPAGAGGRLLGISNIATAGAGVLAGAGGWMLDLFNAQSHNLGYLVLYMATAFCYVLGTIIALPVTDSRISVSATN